MYADFALVYDRLMAEVDYAAWARHYRDLLATNGVMEGAFVLEAACGTGSLTIPLAQHFRLLPSDLSEDMLSVAAAKARAAGLSLRFLRQDMRALSAHKPADALICGCDGVNYLLDDQALRDFFRSAHQVLKPGGVLAFDLSSRDKLSRVLGSGPQVLRETDICYIWENAWEEEGSLLHMSLAIFLREQDGRYLRINEEQTQRAYTEEELRSALQEEGFTKINCYGNYTTRKPAHNAQRLHITAIKE